jgi:hypothetical protein
MRLVEAKSLLDQRRGRVSLTLRFIAVDRGARLSRTVSTVYSGETVKTVEDIVTLTVTQLKQGLNENAARSSLKNDAGATSRLGLLRLADYHES